MKTLRFPTARELANFVNDPANTAITVVSITADPVNGGFWLFYTE